MYSAQSPHFEGRPLGDLVGKPTAKLYATLVTALEAGVDDFDLNLLRSP